MKHDQGLSKYGSSYHIWVPLLLVPLALLAIIGGVMLIRYVINDSLGSIYLYITINESWGLNTLWWWGFRFTVPGCEY